MWVLLSWGQKPEGQQFHIWNWFRWKLNLLEPFIAVPVPVWAMCWTELVVQFLVSPESIQTRPNWTLATLIITQIPGSGLLAPLAVGWYFEEYRAMITFLDQNFCKIFPPSSWPRWVQIQTDTSQGAQRLTSFPTSNAVLINGHWACIWVGLNLLPTLPFTPFSLSPCCCCLLAFTLPLFGICQCPLLIFFGDSRIAFT